MSGHKLGFEFLVRSQIGQGISQILVINRDKGFGKRAAHTHPIFLGVSPPGKREGDEREGGVGRDKRNRLQFYRTLFAYKRGEKKQFDCLVSRQSKSNIIINFPCASTLYRLILLQNMFLIVSKIARFPPVCRSFTSTEQILQLFREVRFLHQFDRA